jgi:prepilin-type N-terminal cleavage/methylation domain-containing protein
MKKTAFTMIELVFVIVVLGILASLAMSRMDRDLTQEASENVLSHIRLTQQLALRDNKHRADNPPNWQRAYWKFDFDCTTSCRYSVGSDIDLDSLLIKEESAIDPIDGKYLFNDGSVDSDFSQNVLLADKFGVDTITASAGCTNSNSIAFDYLGRPHLDINTASNNFSQIMNNDCNLTFGMLASDSFTVTIESETGHAFLVGQPNL